MAPTPPEARRWTARRIISVAILAFLFILVFALAGPGWWRFTPSGDSTAQQGNDIEQMIVGRVTRVRDSEEPWGFVIDDDVVNVWLATRLVPWLEHEGDAELPEGWSDPQVRFGADVIQVGVGSPWYGVVVTDFRPRLEDESVVSGVGGNFGRLDSHPEFDGRVVGPRVRLGPRKRHSRHRWTASGSPGPSTSPMADRCGSRMSRSLPASWAFASEPDVDPRAVIPMPSEIDGSSRSIWSDDAIRAVSG